MIITSFSDFILFYNSKNRHLKFLNLSPQGLISSPFISSSSFQLYLISFVRDLRPGCGLPSFAFVGMASQQLFFYDPSKCCENKLKIEHNLQTPEPLQNLAAESWAAKTSNLIFAVNYLSNCPKAYNLVYKATYKGKIPLSSKAFYCQQGCFDFRSVKRYLILNSKEYLPKLPEHTDFFVF